MKIFKTAVFNQWFEKLKDKTLRALIVVRLDRVAHGNLGDFRSVGDGVLELRIHYGAGYRIYCTKEGEEIILLLCGGGKSTQERDIKKAKEMLQ